MSKTPKSRYSEPKKAGSTIDIDPKDVTRLDDKAAKPGTSEENISDITDPAAIGADKAAAAAVEAKTEPMVASKPEPVKEGKAPTAKMDAAKTDKASASKPAETPKPAPKTDAPKPDAKPATPSAFATSPVSSPRPATAQADSRRGGSALMGGIVGGLIVLALGAGLQAAGIWPGAQPGNDEQVAALQSEIETLRGEIANAGASDDVAALRSEIEELRSASGDTSATDDRLAALEQAIAAVSDAPDAEAALAEVEQQLASAGEASNANAARLDDIEARLGELENSGAQRVIAASALKSAIDRGQPFATELETYAGLDADAAEVGELRDFAADGVATRAQIAEEVGQAAQAMVAASSGVDENAGIMDRLSASARSLVQVRPVGMAEGEDVGAKVARLEASVRADDYERAIAEYDGLPEYVQAAGADFMAKVRARHAADQLIDRALTTALQGA
jgi:hypothetical protein